MKIKPEGLNDFVFAFALIGLSRNISRLLSARQQTQPSARDQTCASLVSEI